MPSHSMLPTPRRSPGFEERLAALPEAPGVYIMKNHAGEVIYVGKAVSLRDRVRSYFRSLRGQAPKVWRMVEEVYDFEYIVLPTELDALIQENVLIKHYKPRYNIRLKDDKTYPFIKVTVHEEWPRVYGTRRVEDDGARYFGPYPGMSTVNEVIDLLDKLFPFRTCDKVITGTDARPCLQYYIHRCLGPCAGLADKKAYDEAIRQVIQFLDGKEEHVIRDMRRKMEQAAENLEFERAAVFRDRIRLLESVRDKQRVFSTTRTDEDVIAFARNDGEACVQVFFIRGGRLLGREYFMLEGTADSPPEEIMRSFIAQFYDGETNRPPPRLVLQHDVGEADVIQAWLRERRGTKVSITVPRRGDRRELVDLAARNAAETLEQLRLRYLSDEQRSTAALTELQQALSLPVWPQRIECYDVAHLQGTDTAGAMVVFEQGLPRKKEYRRFQIRTSANDDFTSMQEMLRRRFRRAGAGRAAADREQATALARAGVRDVSAPSADYEAGQRLREEAQEAVTEARIGDSVGELARKEELAVQYSVAQMPENPTGSNGRYTGYEGSSSDEGNGQGNSWAILPDLIVIDGGKGQLNAALEVLNEVGLADLPVIALAKREEEVFLPGRSESLVLDRRSEALKLLQRIRDEAHRFSNSYNRKLGAKRAVRGRLDAVPHIGPKRKKALMRHFGSIRAIREASIEELMRVEGMDRAAALSIKEHL